jgi:Zn-dependent protease/CBS domain-containing protein
VQPRRAIGSRRAARHAVIATVALKESGATVSGSFTIGRIGGIPIRIHFTWLVILVLLVWSLGADVLPAAYGHWSQHVYWITAVVASVLFFLSVLIHELMHSVVARRRGIPVASITLFIFGGVSQIEQEARNPGTEFAIAIVGPVSSVVIGLVCIGLGFAIRTSFGEPVEATLGYLGTINLLLGIFNMLPAFPLDGGRVLRSALWKRTNSLATATQRAVRISHMLAIGMIVLGLFIALAGAIESGLWLAFIGWFLQQSAASSGQAGTVNTLLDSMHVRDVMITEFEAVRPALPLDQLVEEKMLHGQQRGFPVIGGGKLWGIVTLTDVARVPRDRWPTTPAEDVMTPRSRLKVAHANDTLAQVVQEFRRDGVKQLVVLDAESNMPVGMVSRDDVLHYLNVRRLLGPQPV